MTLAFLCVSLSISLLLSHSTKSILLTHQMFKIFDTTFDKKWIFSIDRRILLTDGFDVYPKWRQKEKKQAKSFLVYLMFFIRICLNSFIWWVNSLWDLSMDIISKTKNNDVISIDVCISHRHQCRYRYIYIYSIQTCLSPKWSLPFSTDNEDTIR